MNKKPQGEYFKRGEITNFRKWTIYRINSPLLNFIHAHVCFKSNITGHYLSEYDFQYEIWQYLQSLYKNTNGVVKREIKGKVDIVIEEKKDEGNTPRVFYELKTYIKPHEKALKPLEIAKDIRKLAFKLHKSMVEYSTHNKMSAYIIIIARRNVIHRIQKINEKIIIHPKVQEFFNDLSSFTIDRDEKGNHANLRSQYTADYIINPDYDSDKKIDRKLLSDLLSKKLTRIT